MAKSENESPVSAEQAPAPSDFPLSLSEFCQRLSGTDKRVELIGAFHHAEKSAGAGQDTEGNFRARFEAFAAQPA